MSVPHTPVYVLFPLLNYVSTEGYVNAQKNCSFALTSETIISWLIVKVVLRFYHVQPWVLSVIFFFFFEVRFKE